MVGPRATRRAIAMATRAYPIILVFAIFAGALVATTALRLAIWLAVMAFKSAY
jgi:hypothetical protein